ncbi:PEP-CTERM-box response regulator transcription factor [Thermodesulfobacteriota bacterium]
MKDKDKLLIIEDDAEISQQLKWAFADEYELYLAQETHSALETLKRKRPAVVTLDLGLPPKPDDSVIGMELLGKIIQLEPNAKVVVVTGNNDRENAMKAISRGAWDYYHKPINIDELKVILNRAFHVNALETENLDRQKELSEKGRLDELIGASPEMNKLFVKIRKVAASNVSALIIGESGTGKELIARAIQNQSARRKNPFVAINCGAIPETLLEAELFGHEKGAFTGAHVQRKGKVEFAEGGTLFFDEIGELTALLQVKLLRFLQERCFERIGGRESISVDARVIAATQKNLKEALNTGEFREDLYYRLSVVTIDVPPLRSRGSDIILLANNFLKKSLQEMKRPIAKFDPNAIEALREYEWPGNVRELENRIKRAVVMSDGPLIRAEDLDLMCTSRDQVGEKTLKDVRESLERDFIYNALLSNSWNVARTAEQIGIARPTLYDLIKKYDLRKQEYDVES